jgi:hypothetical protein
LSFPQVTREARHREPQLHRQNLPESPGARTGRPIAADRDTRIAARLRAVEQEYRAALERDAVSAPPEPAGILRASGLVGNTEIELE